MQWVTVCALTLRTECYGRCAERLRSSNRRIRAFFPNPELKLPRSPPGESRIEERFSLRIRLANHRPQHPVKPVRTTCTADARRFRCISQGTQKKGPTEAAPQLISPKTLFMPLVYGWHCELCCESGRRFRDHAFRGHAARSSA
jgi:hypothetical protein